jgi:hypothetical protein
MTTFSKIVLVTVGLLMQVACSNESLKRNTYQSLQIMQQRDCQQQPGDKDCAEPESYNKYEKQREEELK